jgi:HEAT repeats
MMSRCLITVLLFLLLDPGLIAQAQVPADETATAGAPVLYLDVQASTWRPRGRISFGIEPVLRMKLTSAGFAVTQDPQRPHDLTVTVQYREERGKPIGVNSYGTDISCLILFNPPGEEGQAVAIHESPSYANLVTAPYVDVVQNLETNPYFYFIGDIVRGWHRKLDTTGALIEALDRQFDEERQRPPETPLDTLVSPAETFPDLDAHFAPSAQENAVDELGRLGDARAIDVLEKLMFEAHRNMRLHAVVALGQFDAPSVTPVLTSVAQADTDRAVRDAASRVLAQRATH